MSSAEPDPAICGGPEMWTDHSSALRGLRGHGQGAAIIMATSGQALVDAALHLIEEKGPTGFTLSEAAKTAGVTPAAVYRHFDGREQLIEECARQGHEIFAETDGPRLQRWPTLGAGGLRGDGGAPNLAFARKFPGHYMAMFESGTSMNATPELAAAAAPIPSGPGNRRQKR